MIISCKGYKYIPFESIEMKLESNDKIKNLKKEIELLKNKNKKLEIENYLLKKSRRLNEKLL
jgi:hypothetical protein